MGIELSTHRRGQSENRGPVTRHTVPGRRSFAKLLLAALAILCLAVSPANAGRWINGGTFDPQRGVGVNFLRFLAGEGEGQMTIRCDALDGLWIDAGVAGNAELPEGIEYGGKIEADFTFVQGDERQSVTTIGSVIIRQDGAVLVSIVGANVAPLGRLLLLPFERLDITVAGITRPVPLEGLLEDLQALADRCGAWPA